MKRLILILMVFCLIGCSKEIRPATDSPMRVSAVTVTPTDFGTETPVFLFWLQSDFATFAGDLAAEPYLVAWPYLGIDAYSRQTYDTGKKYPENDGVVCCTGYFPSTLITGRDTEKNHWATLTIPADAIGKTDVMVAPEHITGQASAHFETKPSAEPLEFIHAQSKLNFAAKMGTEMAKNRYLRNVKVTIPGKDQFLSSLKWENGRYIADGILQDEEYKVILQDPNPAQMDPNELQMRELGSVYIRPGRNSITFDLEVEMSETVTFDSYETIRTSEPTTLYFNTNGSDVTLYEGDEFDIDITILYDSFVITGNKANWQDGGKIPLPFYPN